MKIIIVHTGRSKFLELCIQQALKFFSPSDIVLISDVTNITNCTVVKIEEFFDTALEFKSLYLHRSNNPYNFELFCFQRWFIAESYSRMFGIEDSLLLIDSDVLLFSDFNYLLGSKKKIANCRMTGPHVTWFAHRTVLTEFCRFMTDQQSNVEKAASLTRFYETKESEIPSHGGNVCDMHLLGLFCLEMRDDYLNLEDPSVNGLVDNNISVIDGFDVDLSGKHKKIVFKNKVCYLSVQGTLHKANALHFQGGYKNLMSFYAIGPNDPIVTLFLKKLLHVFKAMKSILRKLVPGRSK